MVQPFHASRRATAWASFPKPALRAPGRLRPDADDLLAEVLALEQPDQLARRVLEPVGDVLAVLDPALLQPGAHVLEELREPGREVPDDEHPEGEEIDEGRRQVRRTPVRLGMGLVVV